MKYQHYVDIHHHRIYEFVGISNFMLFVNKQTFDAPSNAGVQFIYACNVGISLTKAWKQLTIIMESWHSKINVYNYDTLAQQHKHLFWRGGGVWFQTCHFY